MTRALLHHALIEHDEGLAMLELGSTGAGSSWILSLFVAGGTFNVVDKPCRPAHRQAEHDESIGTP